MTVSQRILTIIICAAATICTRFLPFVLFAGRKSSAHAKADHKANSRLKSADFSDNAAETEACTAENAPIMEESGSETAVPPYISYLGRSLPAAIFGMLVVYCLKNVRITGGNHAIPELIAIVLTVLLHLWKRKMLLSIAAGTVCYMLMIQFVFVL